jgi:hypothetical protein
MAARTLARGGGRPGWDRHLIRAMGTPAQHPRWLSHPWNPKHGPCPLFITINKVVHSVRMENPDWSISLSSFQRMAVFILLLFIAPIFLLLL